MGVKTKARISTYPKQPGHHFMDVRVGESITNSLVATSYVAVVSKPRTLEPCNSSGGKKEQWLKSAQACAYAQSKTLSNQPRACALEHLREIQTARQPQRACRAANRKQTQSRQDRQVNNAQPSKHSTQHTRIAQYKTRTPAYVAKLRLCVPPCA